jgi:hypothetical protein
MSRLFTVAEANALLPRIKPKIAELLTIRQRIGNRKSALAGVVENASRSNGGSRAASDTVGDMQRFHALVSEINAFGCLLKDTSVGLIDFPAEMNGRTVYLCWRHGEESVSWWHDLEAGYAGRQPIDD